MKRFRMNKRKSRRSFSNSASKSHKKNFRKRSMRGGYRL